MVLQMEVLVFSVIALPPESGGRREKDKHGVPQSEGG
jgi:hypothetical protein